MTIEMRHWQRYAFLSISFGWSFAAVGADSADRASGEKVSGDKVEVRVRADVAGNCRGKRDFVYGFYPFGKTYYLACIGGKSVNSAQVAIPTALIDEFRAGRKTPSLPKSKPPSPEEIARQKRVENDRRVAEALRNWKPDPTPVRRISSQLVAQIAVGQEKAVLDQTLGKPNATTLIPEEEGFLERRTYLIDSGATLVVAVRAGKVAQIEQKQP
jgi:hypothetical protein